ncbi:hypothetical protein F8153_15495 [Alkaliphilus serpentinus]|uniref:Uncharacterized protein n=1 Tax=Alkaliphilus serpentinus TaxID=1482731 RepID=A0A833HL59_9FIRM|nr:hypothetical protein F8153_15495 [Alkaliphilus serpentinus]
MIQIDDAGSGSLLGGTIIGVLRVETEEYFYRVIPLQLYQGEAFQNKSYIDYVVTIINELFNHLRVSKDEEIKVCRGYMFDSLNKWLKENNYNYITTKIKDPLQTLVEKTFDDYAIKLGLPTTYINYTKYPFHFHRILKWVYADYENRSRLCKTGWKSWNKYKDLKPIIKEENVKNKDWLCLKCNKPIPRNTIAAVKAYTSNRHYKIFLHRECI